MENKNDVMGAVMHLQRAMRRGNAAAFEGKHGPKGPMAGSMHGPEDGRAFRGQGPEKPCCHKHGPEKPGCGKHGGMGHGGHHRPNFAAGRLISALKAADSMTTGELAEALDLRPSSLSELLGKLENRGLILRTQDENDKRVYHISLTDSAKMLEEKISAEREAHRAVYTACFTEEEAATFCALCEKLSKHLEALAEVK